MKMEIVKARTTWSIVPDCGGLIETIAISLPQKVLIPAILTPKRYLPRSEICSRPCLRVFQSWHLRMLLTRRLREAGSKHRPSVAITLSWQALGRLKVQISGHRIPSWYKCEATTCGLPLQHATGPGASCRGYWPNTSLSPATISHSFCRVETRSLVRAFVSSVTQAD